MYRSKENPPLYRWKIFDKYSDQVNIAVTSRISKNDNNADNNFNQALHTGDKPERVIENRKIICFSQNIPYKEYTSAEQTHSAIIHEISQEDIGKGNMSYASSIQCSDALIASIPHAMINIHLADCVPIVIYDPIENIGALVHGGWKGTAQLISKKTIEYMAENFDCKAENMIAGIGPSIGSCCFNIGKDTAEKLSASFNYSSEVILYENDQYRADLKQANFEQLMSMDIKADNIEVSTICTSCSNNEFFSYRADGRDTGRFSTFLLLK